MASAHGPHPQALRQRSAAKNYQTRYWQHAKSTKSNPAIRCAHSRCLSCGTNPTFTQINSAGAFRPPQTLSGLRTWRAAASKAAFGALRSILQVRMRTARTVTHCLRRRRSIGLLTIVNCASILLACQIHASNLPAEGACAYRPAPRDCGQLRVEGENLNVQQDMDT